MQTDPGVVLGAQDQALFEEQLLSTLGGRVLWKHMLDRTACDCDTVNECARKSIQTSLSNVGATAEETQGLLDELFHHETSNFVKVDAVISTYLHKIQAQAALRKMRPDYKPTEEEQAQRRQANLMEILFGRGAPAI